jgi:cation diffusion facilitator CzcD-associated flavoprotein CzcO
VSTWFKDYVEWVEGGELTDTELGEGYFDAVVVGAGFGGIYAVHRLRQQGLSVLGLEGASGVGGVWYHNRYPGARVDVESVDYCYHFSPDVYKSWQWTERYATQPEILAYLEYVAEVFDVKRSFLFETWLTRAQWQPEANSYDLTTSTAVKLSCRFLIMAGGNLSKPRTPDFRGLDTFEGELLQTSQWPSRTVDLEGRRIGVIGTGSSGIQVIPKLAEVAEHLYVFQRSPNFSVPARNCHVNQDLYEGLRSHADEAYQQLLNTRGGSHKPGERRPAAHFSAAEQKGMLEAGWAYGGTCMNTIFGDQGTSLESNNLVAEFVRSKIREAVNDSAVAEKLCPTDHPIGSRRLCVDTNYYETYNRSNVSLVDVRESPIVSFAQNGINTIDGKFDLDVIVLALGFEAFTGSLDSSGIRNEKGVAVTERWSRGPRTFLGLMSHGFPNLFHLTGPGSPSVLANLAVGNEFHVDFVADLVAYMNEEGYERVEPTLEAESEWTEHVADVSRSLLRLHARNYMVHVNDDGSRIFMPYSGGLDRYVSACKGIVERNYMGLDFD